MNQEEKIINLSNQILKFEFEDNFARITFNADKTLEEIEKSLKEIGITDIFHKHVNMSGNRQINTVFVLDYVNKPKQKTIIDILETKYKRINALKTLLHNGGTQLSEGEKHFIDYETVKINSLKMQSKSRN